MYRISTFVACILTTLLLACAAPVPEPGMEVLHHGQGEEMQIATNVEWNSYTKIILHTAPVEFRKNWKSDQERLQGKVIRDSDIQRIKTAVAAQFDKAMFTALSDRGGYEMTRESGPGVMHFMPNIVDLDVQEAGLVQNSILESLPESRGSMTVELVIRDSVSDKLLGVAWQNQSDPRGGYMEMTISVNNATAFRLMSKSWASWLLKRLDEAKSRP